MNNIISQKSSNNSLLKKLNFNLYICWDNKNNKFFRPILNNSNCVFLNGIWISKEDAEIDSKNKYKIINIDLSKKIPNSIIHIANLGEDFSKEEKERMINSKFIQILDNFIFNNKEFKNQLKKLYNGD